MTRFKSILIAVFAVLVSAAYVLPSLPASAVSSASLSIVPKKNYLIEAGKSVNDKLTIRNLDNVQPLLLSLRVVDFTYSDDGGTPKLNLAENVPETTWSLRSYLTVPESVTIPAGGSKTLDMKVSIPANVGAGSYYSAIVYSSGSGTGGNVGLSASGVTLVFTSVPGQVTEDLHLEKLGAYDETAKSGTDGYVFFASKEPQSIGYTLKNNGNVTESPVGSIKLKDMFGRETTVTDVNPSGSLALIGQTRTFSACINLSSAQVDFNGGKSASKTCASPGLWPGYYSISLDLYYGQNGNKTQEVVGSSSFWYLPMWFVITALIVLLVAAFFIWRLVRMIRVKVYGFQPPRRSSSRRK